MQSASVLVLGSNGMLGHAVSRAFSERAGWTVTGTQVEDAAAPNYLNAAEPAAAWTPLVGRGYGYIVNCIGILKPAIDESDSASVARAIEVNALFPHRLAAAAAGTGTRVIQMSTDGVFSADSAKPYLETDPTDCPDAYGKTKALGESPAPNVLNIRCSIIGRDPVWRKGLIEWVLGSPDGSELQGYENHVWNGVTVVQFAGLCRRIAESGTFDRIRGASAVHHFCPNPPITKYDLLETIRQVSLKQVIIRRVQAAAAARRVLSTRFTELAHIYPGGATWEKVIGQAIDDIPE